MDNTNLIENQVLHIKLSQKQFRKSFPEFEYGSKLEYYIDKYRYILFEMKINNG